eukprot:SAG31_NODE_10291_length_1159_cov_1.276415_1_plen_99_part_00
MAFAPEEGRERNAALGRTHAWPLGRVEPGSARAASGGSRQLTSSARISSTGSQRREGGGEGGSYSRRSGVSLGPASSAGLAPLQIEEAAAQGGPIRAY